jgi:hypothetical protein
MDMAMTIDGRSVFASSARKGVRYFCLNCGNEAIFARGEINRPHFRHKDAKNKREVLQCEYYVSNYSNYENAKIYDNEFLTRCRVRLELCEDDGKWGLYLRFPVIKPEFHALVDRHHLHFQIRCEEEDRQFSSSNLLGFQSAYKIPVRIRNAYTISVSEPKIEERLQLKISGIYRPFENSVLLFKFVQGSLLHVPYRNVILSGRFFVLTKKALKIPEELRLIGRQKIEDWVLHELLMPDKLSDSLKDWFSRELRINLLTAAAHLDLVQPNVFRFNNGLVEVTGKSVELLITHNGISPQVTMIHVIDPYGRQNRISTKERLFRIDLALPGLYSIYFANQHGEMLELNCVSHLQQEACQPLFVEANGEQILFSERELTSREITLTANCPVTVYLKKGKPSVLKRPNQVNLVQVERIHLPFFWSIRFREEVAPTINDVVPRLLEMLEQRAKYHEVYLGSRRFRDLREMVAKSSHPRKNRLILLLNMKPNVVPRGLLTILQKVGDEA